MINGNIYGGATHAAGEWGHHTIHPTGGFACYCGKDGCVEAHISGAALEERWSNLTGNAKKPLTEIVRSLGDLQGRGWCQWKDEISTRHDIVNIEIENLGHIRNTVKASEGRFSACKHACTIYASRITKLVFVI